MYTIIYTECLSTVSTRNTAVGTPVDCNYLWREPRKPILYKLDLGS